MQCNVIFELTDIEKSQMIKLKIKYKIVVSYTNNELLDYVIK